MWKGKKRVGKAELVENLEHRRVNRIPAKIAQEITMLLEDDNADAGAGEEVTENRARGAAADDTTVGSQQSTVGSRLVAVRSHGPSLPRGS